jgi:hypothetical protein
MKTFAILCSALLWSCPGKAWAQRVTREEILAVYSFSPHTLTKEERDQKSRALDVFWNQAKTQRNTCVPILKGLLQRTNAPPFFLFDGSRLLLDLSNTTENRRIALQALARCDLRDVDGTVYLEDVHRLATTGADTTDAAFHILDDPKFKAFIPQHALTLGQDFCLILALFPTDSAYWLRRAINRLETEPDPEAQRSLLYLLWYAQVSESDAAVADFARATDKPAASREFAQQLAARNEKLLTELASHGKAPKPHQSEISIRKARVKTLRRISDEALSEFDQETLNLIAIRSAHAK